MVRMTKRVAVVGALGLTLALVLAACGGGDEEPTATPRPTATPVPTAAPTATPTLAAVVTAANGDEVGELAAVVHSTTERHLAKDGSVMVQDLWLGVDVQGRLVQARSQVFNAAGVLQQEAIVEAGSSVVSTRSIGDTEGRPLHAPTTVDWQAIDLNQVADRAASFASNPEWSEESTVSAATRQFTRTRGNGWWTVSLDADSGKIVEVSVYKTGGGGTPVLIETVKYLTPESILNPSSVPAEVWVAEFDALNGGQR